VSEKVTKDEAGRRRFKGLSSQRLSNIVRLSYIGAQIKSLLPKHIQSMASSKVDIVGIPEKVFLSHCQWTSMQTFKKYYKKKFSSDLRIGDQLRSGDVDKFEKSGHWETRFLPSQNHHIHRLPHQSSTSKQEPRTLQ
jgi:hypothetical protein